jgi:hypothetical protein
MEHSNISLIQANEIITKKEKIYKEKPKKNKSITIFLCYGLSISILVNIIFFSYIILFQKKSSNINENQYINIENEKDINPNCTKLDTILVFSQRLNKGPKTICDNGNSNHICYQNLDGYYNDIFLIKMVLFVK